MKISTIYSNNLHNVQHRIQSKLSRELKLGISLDLIIDQYSPTGHCIIGIRMKMLIVQWVCPLCRNLIHHIHYEGVKNMSNYRKVLRSQQDVISLKSI